MIILFNTTKDKAEASGKSKGKSVWINGAKVPLFDIYVLNKWDKHPEITPVSLKKSIANFIVFR